MVHPAPHPWTDEERRLHREVAGRTWAAVERARAEAALRESEERHRLIVEGARDYAILTTDPAGRIASWSPGAEAVFGWPAADALGRPFAVTFTPEDRARGEPERELAGARAAGAAPDVRWHLRRDGARVFIDGVTRALADGAGGVRGFLKIGQDVTRRRQTEEALRASEARFRTLVENIRDYAIFRLDPQGVVTEWTAGAQRVTGYAAEEVLGRPAALFYPPEAVAAGAPAGELAEAARTGRAAREGWRVRKGGRRFWVDEIATAIRAADGRLVGFTTISRDLTERRRAAAERERRVGAEAAAAERRALLQRVVAAQEEERRRVAHEVHDGVAQLAHAAALRLDDLAERLAPGVPPTAADLADLARARDLARRAAADARRMIAGLRPEALDALGLAEAVRQEVAALRAEGWRADYAGGGPAPLRLPPAAETTLFRIAQEALTNVRKHAGPGVRVRVRLAAARGGARLTVQDWGRGFDPAAAGAAAGSGWDWWGCASGWPCWAAP